MHWLRVVHHVLKTLAYALCAVGCLYQCASILKIYFSFPSTVTNTVEVMDALTLPAMTICNNNRIMLSKLKAFDPSFASQWDQLVNQLRKRVQVSQTKVAVQRLLDQTVRALMDTLSVNEFATLGFNWTDLISPDHFRCATDPYNLNNKCLKYANIIESAQEEGNCFTIFSRTSNDFLKNIAVKSGLGQSPVIHGIGDSLNLEISEQPFHPNEIFRMMVNFSIRDYTTLNDKVVGQILVHDENEIPAIRQRSHLISPGFFYEFYVTKETDKYLPHPYETDCVRYDFTGEGDEGLYLPSVLSRESCIFDCMGTKTVELCGCWPPELPYVLNNNTEHRLKWCSWRDGVNVNTNVSLGNNTNYFRKCFSNFEPQCNSQCKIQCEVDKYTTLRQSFQWPSKERMDHSTKYNKEFRECCSIISLRFWSAEQTTLKYEPKYEFVEFSSYFGGLLSIYLGFSLVKTYDIAELVLRKIFQKYRSGKGLVWPFKQATAATKAGIARPRVAKYYKTKHVQNISI